MLLNYISTPSHCLKIYVYPYIKSNASNVSIVNLKVSLRSLYVATRLFFCC